MLRPLRMILAVLGASLLLVGCGGAWTGTAHGTPTGTSSAGGATIEITVKGRTLSPQGASIEVAVGRPITLHIVADQPGELHLHSSPQQEIHYRAGTTDSTVTIDRPGVVELESHTLGRLVAQLEVR